MALVHAPALYAVPHCLQPRTVRSYLQEARITLLPVLLTVKTSSRGNYFGVVCFAAPSLCNDASSAAVSPKVLSHHPLVTLSSRQILLST